MQFFIDVSSLKRGLGNNKIGAEPLPRLEAVYVKRLKDQSVRREGSMRFLYFERLCGPINAALSAVA